MGLLLPINDGFNFDGFLKAADGRPAVKFPYRPALPERVIQYQMAPRNNPKEAIKALTDLLVDQLVSWDVTDTINGIDTATAPTVDVLRRVPLQVLGRMADIVTGYAKSDELESDQKN